MPAKQEFLGSVPLKEDKSRLSIESTLAATSLTVLLTALWPNLAQAKELIEELVGGSSSFEDEGIGDNNILRLAASSVNSSPFDAERNAELLDIYFPNLNGNAASLQDLPLNSQGTKPFQTNNNQRLLESKSALLPNGFSANNSQLFIGGGTDNPNIPNLVTRDQVKVDHLPIYSERDQTNVDNLPIYSERDQTNVDNLPILVARAYSPLQGFSSTIDENSTLSLNNKSFGLSNSSFVIESDDSKSSRDLSGLDFLTNNISLLNLANQLMNTGNFNAPLSEVFDDADILLSASSEINGSSRSLQESSIINIDSENKGAINSLIQNFRDIMQTIYITANDLIGFTATAGKDVVSRVSSETKALENSVLETGNSDDIINIKANIEAEGVLSTNSEEYDIHVGLNSIGIDGSTLLTKSGDDQILISATMKSNDEMSKPGVSIEPVGNNKLPKKGSVNVDLKTIAVNNSTVSTSSGNDNVLINSSIDEYLNGQIDSANTNDDFTLNVDKSLVSLNKSILDTGDGDDLILLRGNIQSSVIESGSGKDQVIVQGAIDNLSQINIDEEDVFIRLPLLGRIEFLPETNKDWDATKNSEVSLIMGNNDINTIQSLGKYNDHVEVYGQDSGKFYNTNFTSFENVDLDAGDDELIITGVGSLSGVVDAGTGVDTLSLSESNYSFGPSLYSGFTNDEINKFNFGNLLGFENIIGSNNGDIFILQDESSDLESITLGGGKDVLGFDLTNFSSNDNITSRITIDDFNLGGGDTLSYKPNGSNGEWTHQERIPLVSEDLLRNGTISFENGLAIGLNNTNQMNGSLYANLGDDHNIEIAKLKNIIL